MKTQPKIMMNSLITKLLKLTEAQFYKLLLAVFKIAAVYSHLDHLKSRQKGDSIISHNKLNQLTSSLLQHFNATLRDRNQGLSICQHLLFFAELCLIPNLSQYHKRNLADRLKRFIDSKCHDDTKRQQRSEIVNHIKSYASKNNISISQTIKILRTDAYWKPKLQPYLDSTLKQYCAPFYKKRL